MAIKWPRLVAGHAKVCVRVKEMLFWAENVSPIDAYGMVGAGRKSGKMSHFTIA